MPSTLHNGLKGYWKLDGNAVDSLGITNGTPSLVTWGTGKIGQCGAFLPPATISLSNNPAVFTVTNQLSMSLWFKTTSMQTNKYLFGRTLNMTSNNNFDLRINGAGIGPSFVGIGSIFYQSPFNYYDGNWHHIVATLNVNTLVLYIDGNVINTVTGLSGTIPASTGIVSICGVSGQNPADGSIDEVGFWNRGLTSAEALELYGGGSGLSYPFSKNNFFSFF